MSHSFFLASCSKCLPLHFPSFFVGAALPASQHTRAAAHTVVYVIRSAPAKCVSFSMFRLGQARQWTMFSQSLLLTPSVDPWVTPWVLDLLASRVFARSQSRLFSFSPLWLSTWKLACLSAPIRQPPSEACHKHRGNVRDWCKGGSFSARVVFSTATCQHFLQDEDVFSRTDHSVFCKTATIGVQS